MSSSYKRTYGSSALIRNVNMTSDVFSAMLKNLILRTTSVLLQELSVKPGEQVYFSANTGLAQNPQHPECHELQVETSMQVYVGQAVTASMIRGPIWPPKDRYEFNPERLARLRERDKQPKPLPALLKPNGDLL
jgi:hypothetical protein